MSAYLFVCLLFCHLSIDCQHVYFLIEFNKYISVFIYRLFAPMPETEIPEDKALKELKTLWLQISQVRIAFTVYLKV